MGRAGTGTMPVPNKFRLFFEAKQSLKPRAANNTLSQPEMAIGFAISALELVLHRSSLSSNNRHLSKIARCRYGNLAD